LGLDSVPFGDLGNTRLARPDPERGGAGEEKSLTVTKRLVIPRLGRGIQKMDLPIIPLDAPVSSTAQA
jgi:hypothetical protein